MSHHDLCACSPCERRRFRSWARKARALQARKDSLKALDDIFDEPLRLGSERLFTALFRRLQGAHPLGMTQRIVCAAARIVERRFTDAADELDELAHDETECMRLNPDERACPRRAAK